MAKPTKFPGITADAKALGVSRFWLLLVLQGRGTSAPLSRRYAALKRAQARRARGLSGTALSAASHKNAVARPVQVAVKFLKEGDQAKMVPVKLGNTGTGRTDRIKVRNRERLTIS